MTKNDSRFRHVFGIKMNVKLNNKLYENDNLKKKVKHSHLFLLATETKSAEQQVL